MFLSEQLNEDVRAIIAAGSPKEGLTDMNAAHRTYVKLVHLRKWDRTTATAVYWAWRPVLQKRYDEEDIPF